MRSRSLIVAVMVAAIILPARAATSAEIIKDGSFESTPAGQDNPNWVEGGVAPPICDVDTCGDDGGRAGPRGTGKNWAWFGGVPTPDLQSLSQEVTIPAGVATLTFYLWIGAASGTGLDILRVYIGDEKVFEVLEDATGYEAYKQVTIDVGAHAGVGPRDLSFEFDGTGGPFFSNFSVDDVSLQAGAPSAKTVALRGPKSVDEGKKAKLKAAVTPCAGHEGDTIELFRGKKRVASAASDTACTHTFKVNIAKTAKFRAVSPKQDNDHEAGTSKRLKVRAR